MKNHLMFGALLGAALALVGPLAGEGRGDFNLTGNEQLTVTESHDNGTLWGTSRAVIAPGGSVVYINAYNSSSVDISGGSVGGLIAYAGSSVDISSGSVSNYLQAYASSSVHISDGSVNNYLSANDDSSVDISGGSVNELNAYNSSSSFCICESIERWCRQDRLEPRRKVRVIGRNQIVSLTLCESVVR